MSEGETEADAKQPPAGRGGRAGRRAGSKNRAGETVSGSIPAAAGGPSAPVGPGRVHVQRFLGNAENEFGVPCRRGDGEILKRKLS